MANRSTSRYLFATWLGLCWALLGALPPLEADDKPSAERRREHRSPHRGQDRWGQLDPRKRQEIQRAFERLRSLPKEKRDELLRSLRGLDSDARRRAMRKAVELSNRTPRGREEYRRREGLARHAWGRFSRDLREKLSRMSKDEQRAYFDKAFRDRREKLLESLPEDVRAEIRALSPREQASRLRDYRAEQRVEEIFRPEEVAKIRALDASARRKLFSPRRSRSGPFGPPWTRRRPPRHDGAQKEPRHGHHQESGDTSSERPEFLSSETWQRWNQLPGYERWRVLDFLGDDKGRAHGPRHHRVRKGPRGGERATGPTPSRRGSPRLRPPGGRPTRRNGDVQDRKAPKERASRSD